MYGWDFILFCYCYNPLFHVKSQKCVYFPVHHFESLHKYWLSVWRLPHCGIYGCSVYIPYKPSELNIVQGWKSCHESGPKKLRYYMKKGTDYGRLLLIIRISQLKRSGMEWSFKTLCSFMTQLKCCVYFAVQIYRLISELPILHYITLPS